MDKNNVLAEIFGNDPLGLLKVKAKVSHARTADERLVSSFLEINSFIDDNGREPESSMFNITEHQLFARLKGIRDDVSKIASLKEFDTYNLLDLPLEEEKEISSIDDIFGDDSFDLLGGDTEGLFDLKHVPSSVDRAEADFVARRKPCKDFAKYEPLFKEVHKELVDGKRKYVDFKEDNLRQGDFYVHKGMLMYLKEINISQEERTFASGKRIRKDGRTRCIFENGTESNMLYRSIAKALYINGKVLTENIDSVNEKFIEKLSSVNDDDEAVGYLYVLRSLSNDSRIKEIDDLYKIGYSTVSVEDRIRNAVNEPTYLMAPVSIVGAWKCFNMNPQKFEQLVHTFFGLSCLELDVYDSKGKRCNPREWFVAPIRVIEQAIELIINGKIVDYRYDVDNKAIVRR